jgi:hypothetical protein
VVQVIYRVRPGRDDKLLLYYCLMAKRSGLGNNMELI